MSETEKVAAEGVESAVVTNATPAVVDTPVTVKKEVKLNADVKAFVPRAAAAEFVPRTAPMATPVPQSGPMHGGRGGKGYNDYYPGPQSYHQVSLYEEKNY